LKALILAGGYATRLRPLSCSNPKLLFPVVGVPLIDLIVGWLREAGIDDVILAVNHLSDRLRIEVGEGRLGSKITLSVEENPLGTAGPIRLAKDLLEEEPFVVVNGDVVSDIGLKQMIKDHQDNEAKATIGLVTVPDARPYGTVEVDAEGRITRFEEKSKKRGSHAVNAGVYVLDPSVTELIPPNKPTSMELTIFPSLARDGGIWGWKHTGYWYDIGTIADYLRANKELLARFHKGRPSRFTEHEQYGGFSQAALEGDASTSQVLERRSGVMETSHGVVIKQPSFIGEDSTLQRGVTLGPGAILSRGVSIANNAVVRDSIIFEHTSLGRDCVVDGAIIGERVTVGSGTRIGRGAVIAGEVNITSNSLIKQKAVILN
jgi:NDP-sugar pyrophosphorylase family protein